MFVGTDSNEIQITTFGSQGREHLKTQSQNLVFSPNALKDLRKIMDDYKLGL